MMQTQTDRVFAAFGGPMGLHRALAETGHWISPSTIYRWHSRPDTRRQDGVIPEKYMGRIRAAAKKRGIKLEEKS